ncbi:MAG TPA: glycosyltransferase family 2 protein [Woeseiaceae bacterium]
MAVTSGYEQQTWVVVPALNEGKVIRSSITALRAVFANVVAVDDGSKDATGAEALEAGAVVVRHPLNLGQGAAIQTGLEFALSRGAAYVATFDADGQHRAEDLQRMLHLLCREQCDIVLGSRFLGRTEGMSRTRFLLIKAAAIFTNLTTGVRLTDAHNGLRVMTADTARRLHIMQDRMAHASEIIARIGQMRLKVREAPVTVTYSSYSTAKGQKMSNSYRILLDLFVGWLLR